MSQTQGRIGGCRVARSSSHKFPRNRSSTHPVPLGISRTWSLSALTLCLASRAFALIRTGCDSDHFWRGGRESPANIMGASSLTSLGSLTVPQQALDSSRRRKQESNSTATTAKDLFHRGYYQSRQWHRLQ